MVFEEQKSVWLQQGEQAVELRLSEEAIRNHIMYAILEFGIFF